MSTVLTYISTVQMKTVTFMANEEVSIPGPRHFGGAEAIPFHYTWRKIDNINATNNSAELRMKLSLCRYHRNRLLESIFKRRPVSFKTYKTRITSYSLMQDQKSSESKLWKSRLMAARVENDSNRNYIPFLPSYWEYICICNSPRHRSVYISGTPSHHILFWHLARS